MQEQPLKQPLLPRVGMLWFFVMATIAAVGLGIIRSAENGRMLAAAMVFTVLFLITFFVLSGVIFTIAYFLGVTEKALEQFQEQPGSPFADAGLPDQIIPPRPTIEE